MELETVSKFQTEDSEIDYMASFFQRGLDHVLENILNNLNLKSLLTCRKVSPEWCQIVNYFMTEQKNPKLQKQHQTRLEAEWMRKDPWIVKLETLKISNLQCDMIADEKHLVVVPTGAPVKIFVLDAESFEIVETLNLKTFEGNLIEAYEIKVSMDDNYLIAFVHEIDIKIQSKDLPFFHVWDRNKNYSLTSLRLETTGELGLKNFAPFNACNLPSMHQGVLAVPKQNRHCFVEHWDIKDQKMLRSKLLRTHEEPVNEVRIPETGFSQLKGKTVYLKRDSHKLSLHNVEDETLVWQKIGSEKSWVFIVGRSSEHCAVAWVECHAAIWAMDIIRLEDGRVLKTFSIGTKFRFNFLSVQMNNGRLAFQGILKSGSGSEEFGNDYDITVFDMKTWDVIVQCGKDLGLDNAKSFLLNKNGLVLLRKSQLVSVRFWL